MACAPCEKNADGVQHVFDAFVKYVLLPDVNVDTEAFQKFSGGCVDDDAGGKDYVVGETVVVPLRLTGTFA